MTTVTMIVAVVFFIGRVIFGLYWLQVAYNHFKHSAMLAGYAQSKGVKSGKAAVIGSGILALLGGLSILFGVLPRVGIFLLVVFLLGVSFGIHTYWKIADPQAKQMERVQFNKNMAILAALLMLFSLALPWVWSI